MKKLLERIRTFSDSWLALLLALGFALRLLYLRATPFQTRGHDIDGHIEYIEYLLKHHALPKNDAGFSFYHPGLYFILAALQWKVLEALHAARGAILVSLQVQSVVWELGYAALAVAAGRLWIRELPEDGFGQGLMSRRAITTLYAVLVVLWPSTMMHSVRIGNDDLVYLFFGASFYFTTKWWFDGRDRDLTLAAVSAAFGVVTKTNALVLFVILAILIAVRLALVEKERRPLAFVQRGWVTVGLGVLSFGVALGTAVRDAIAGTRPSVLIGNSVSTKLLVGNRAENYLWFDVPTFVSHAFMNPWGDAEGRQWFWNYLLKSALSGEFRFDSIPVWNIAVCVSIVFLFLLAYVVGGLLAGEGGGRVRWLPVTLTAAVLVASLAALRARHPNACSNDFRYILPVLTPFLLGYVYAITEFWRRGWKKLAARGAMLGWLFAGLSVALIVAIGTIKNP